MFLSRISIVPSPHSAKALVELGVNGAYTSHQLLWKLFPEQEKRSFLYREEMTGNGLPQYYVLSRTQPVTDNPLFAVQTKTFAPQLSEGTKLGFSLRVNPTISKKHENGKNKRHDVMMHAKFQAKQNKIADPLEVQQQMNDAALHWLNTPERLERWGMQLDSTPSIENYTQHKTEGKQKIQFSSVDIEGVLTVTDTEKFLNQHYQGYGRAKSMGCGLMLIRLIN